jgi:Phosphotransferase enzyme family
MGDEQQLAGGMDPAAGVVRVGDTVRRPAGRSAHAVRSLLLHLEQVGFDEAPRFLGTDEKGRDVLTFVEGNVPLPPYPSWALTDAALQELGRLIRRFHEATATFDAASVTGWSDHWADPDGGRLICHNDLFPENVVFRDGHVVGLIDFAEAAPGRPFWDLAIAAQEWAPLHAPGWRLHHPDHLGGVRRTALLARAYGIEPEQAAELVDVVAQERVQQLGHVREQVAAGAEPWATFWSESNGEERAAADDRWLRDQRSALIEAIQDGLGTRP